MRTPCIFGVLLAASTLSGAGFAAPMAYRNMYTNSDVFIGENIGQMAPSGKYSVAARFDYSLINFDNEYSLKSDPSDSETDKFSFEPVLGFDVAAGYQFSPKWRAELNYGFTGKFEDSDSDTTYEQRTSFLTINGIYTIQEWNTTSIYAGAGLGVGFLTTKHGGVGTFHPSAETTESSVGFAGSLQFGLEEKISSDVRLVLSYKLGYMTGHEQSILLADESDYFVSKNTGILSNSFGLGLRFTF